MAQITSGIRGVLSVPSVYNLLQTLLGTHRSKARLVTEFFGIQPGHRVLDIGCGTGLILNHIPETVNYTGIDGSSDYIDHATRLFGSRARFIRQTTDEMNMENHQPFDRILAMGLLHHLEDEEALDLFRFAKSALVAGSGEFHSIDPCFAPGQSPLSKMMVDRDRGQNVRTLEGYQSLADRVFKHVSITHRNNMLRIPYDHAILRCS